MTKFDDASWHYGGDFPSDLTQGAAYTHIGVYLGWCIDNGLHSEMLEEHFASEVRQFRRRTITGSHLVSNCCDGKLTSEDLSEEAAAFSAAYYETNTYFRDYSLAIGAEYPTLYHVPDDWRTYDRVARVLSRRWNEWRSDPRAFVPKPTAS